MGWESPAEGRPGRAGLEPRFKGSSTCNLDAANAASFEKKGTEEIELITRIAFLGGHTEIHSDKRIRSNATSKSSVVI